MSKSRNANGLAKKIVRQTSLKQVTASRLAKQVHAHFGFSVVDSPSPSQRSLEACVAHVLASAFQDRQLNGVLLGVRRAEPEGQSLKLTLEPEMANEILHELLPRFDHSYGGVRGVPGLRVRGHDRQLNLYDATTSAHITMARADGGPMRLPSAQDDEVLLWKRVPGGLTRDEELESGDWTESRGIRDLGLRDLLLSRILRSPEVVNRVAGPHGFANCYTHHAGDLVIEWCCGDTVEAICALLMAHGFVADVPRASAIELLSGNSARFGGFTVILNRHASCVYGGNAEDVAELIRKAYEA
jgi:hypothetical protein